LDFNNKVKYVVTFGESDLQLHITESIINMWIIMGVLILFAVIVRIRLKSFTDLPTGFQNIVEFIVEAFNGFVVGTAGPKMAGLGHWYFMVFSFIILSNLSGMLTLRPPTADWTVTFAFALSTFVLIQITGIRYRGWKYLKSFFEPFFLFLPLNILGELARPIALSFRLFGNILSGLILMGVVYALVPLWLQVGIPAALHAYFDLFIGLIQAYIFTVLSLAFIGAAAEDAPA
jgi:F-type H+-transporting ATPase subunit a